MKTNFWPNEQSKSYNKKTTILEQIFEFGNTSCVLFDYPPAKCIKEISFWKLH
ncbi:hypothetical protein NC99_19620 [Sunxiuqinia dokdonensis]|uniref:Uncharacterized protein n=1 Tax=Sunxiuqinia dokdonensis TaxID=1409788 RepID=A0A0L8V9E4_9BACT|nr:hypothetical protein NC99_19620 [Sunxiuqinia dokdonensis]